MKKRHIVKEKKDFDKAFKLGKKKSCKYAYIYIKDNNLDNYRFGICVSKKIGKANVRNKIKRRVKDIIDKSKLLFPNKDYIIVLKQNALDAKYCELNEDLIEILKNINE